MYDEACEYFLLHHEPLPEDRVKYGEVNRINWRKVCQELTTLEEHDATRVADYLLNHRSSTWEEKRTELAPLVAKVSKQAYNVLVVELLFSDGSQVESPGLIDDRPTATHNH